MARTSLFITCYSFIEHELVQICNLQHKRHNYKIKLKDLHGDGIKRAAEYLTKVADINFPNDGID